MSIVEKYFSMIKPLIDTDRIKRIMAELTDIEKPTDFDSFEKAVAYMNGHFKNAGYDLQTLYFPADGETPWHSYTAPIGFRTTKAVCTLVEPAEFKKVLGDRDIEPNTAIMGCGHTGPEGVTAEVVHIKETDDFSKLDIKDKIVYCASMHPTSIRAKVVEGGALAQVSSFTEKREHNYKFVKWVNTGSASADGWMPEKAAAEQDLPGISLSPEMGDYIEDQLAKGPVKLNVTVEGEYFLGKLPSLNVFSAGEKEESVIVTGHMFEQGLIDNASGAVVSLTAGEIMNKIRNDSGIKSFKRGLRHFHGQECYCVLGLHKLRPDVLKGVFAHVNIDGVGEPGCTLMHRQGLLATYNFSDFLMQVILKYAAKHLDMPHKHSNMFEINCTLLADPKAGGVSTSYLSIESSGLSWHTSRDRNESMEPEADMLELNTLTTTSWLYFMLTAGREEVLWLLDEFKEQITSDFKENKTSDTGLYMELKKREMNSLLMLVEDEDKAEIQNKINDILDGIDKLDYVQKIITPEGGPELVQKSKELLPESLLGGPATASNFSAEELKIIGGPMWDHRQLVLKAWANGERSIYDITRWAIFECGPHSKFSLDYTIKMFEIYAKNGLVRLRNSAF
jgi:hypothetical protein